MKDSLRLARIVSTSFTFETLLYDQIAAIRDAGIEITLIAEASEKLSQISHAHNIPYLGIPITRGPDFRRDVQSLIKLTLLLRQHSFDIVHSSTPKAGLLTAVAGCLSRIPIRLHTFTGQRWVTLTGHQRILLRSFDRLIGVLSTRTYADSVSQKLFLLDEGIVRPDKIKVLGKGSISGVNMTRFDPEKWGGDTRINTRRELGVPADALVIVFIGRVTRDKGIVELIQAFVELRTEHENLYLLLVGPFEPELDPLPLKTHLRIESNQRIIKIGFCSEPEKYLAASDIFCLPSYREGFGSVIVEAGAMGLPSVATSIVGLVDAIVENQTGLLVPPQESVALTNALAILIAKPEQRETMGAAARKRVQKFFDARFVNQYVVDEYKRLAENHKKQP